MELERRLHIGGKVRKEGWEVFNIVPSNVVDHVGDARDLSRFPDNTFVELYASHVLEHFDYMGEAVCVLKEWKRVLNPGGVIYVSVPNLYTLCSLFVHLEALPFEDRFMLMRIIYGGHMDSHDYHKTGYFPELLSKYLQEAGFKGVMQTENFDLFGDNSQLTCYGINLSLNMLAYKPD